MRDILVRESRLEDATVMAPNLRGDDLSELVAALGPSVVPEDVLRASIRYSDDPRTVLVDGEPAAIFGVVDMGETNPSVGSIWLMGTPVILDIRREFLRQCRAQLAMQESTYDILTNFVDSRNTVHIKWLQWLGFSIIRKEENYGEGSQTFYEFARANIYV